VVTALPFVIVAMGLRILHKRKPFGITKSLTALAGVAVLFFKNVINFLAVYVIFLKHEVGLIDDLSNAITQLACISLSVVMSVATMRTTTAIAIYEYQQDVREQIFKIEHPNAENKIPRMQKLIVMQYIAELRKVVACLPDLVVLCAQVYAVIALNEVTSAIILALLLNAFGIGGALKSLKVSDLLSLFAQYEGLPMQRNMTWGIYASSFFNPCYTEFSLMKAVLVSEVTRRAALKYEEMHALNDKAIELEENEVHRIEAMSKMSEIEIQFEILKQSTLSIGQEIVPLIKQKSS